MLSMGLVLWVTLLHPCMHADHGPGTVALSPACIMFLAAAVLRCGCPGAAGCRSHHPADPMPHTPLCLARLRSLGRALQSCSRWQQPWWISITEQRRSHQRQRPREEGQRSGGARPQRAGGSWAELCEQCGV